MELIYLITSINIYSWLSITVNGECAPITPASCTDIEFTGSIWGYTAKGVDISAYTGGQLQWIGCLDGFSTCPTNTWYCEHTSSTIEFGTTAMVSNNKNTTRALMGPGSFPTDGAGCPWSKGPRGTHNGPGGASSIVALCEQLGYKNGVVERFPSNACGEPWWDGNNWNPDFGYDAGHGRTYKCSSLCIPTNAPTQAPSNAPTQAPSNAPTQAPSNAPTDSSDSIDDRSDSIDDRSDSIDDRSDSIDSIVRRLLLSTRPCDGSIQMGELPQCKHENQNANAEHLRREHNANNDNDNDNDNENENENENGNNDNDNENHYGNSEYILKLSDKTIMNLWGVVLVGISLIILGYCLYEKKGATFYG